MSTLDLFLTYFGTIVLVLIFLYGTKNYWISLIAGFIVFCIFYFDYGVKTFEWTISSMAPHVKDAGIIFIISFVIGVIIYKLLPVKQTGADILPQ
jgi:hypothetical protein